MLIGCVSMPPSKPVYDHHTQASPETIDDYRRRQIIRTATAMIGKPYRYGGTTPEQGFDCSGLVQFSHNQAGIRVPRTAAQQLQNAKSVDFNRLQPGDLLFFRINGKPTHVTIYLGGGEFIHAPSSGGRVRTEQVSQPYWRERLYGIGSFF
ncbi:MAG: C40 family peptidase [Candidatus Sedimenticola sp. 6PFRAG7]